MSLPRSLVWMAPVALACAACSGVDAQRRAQLFETEARARYPEPTWIVGVGEGATRAEAETAARTQAAGQVKSSIHARFAAMQEERVKGGKSLVEQTVVNQVTSEVDSAYGHVFKPVEAQEIGGRWRALAAARRMELDQTIAADAAQKARAAEPIWKRIAEAPTWLAAAPGWCDARAAAEALDRLDLERQAVSRSSVWTPERRAAWTAAEQRFTSAKGHLVTVVSQSNGGPDVAQPIVSALQQAGWRGEQGAGACAGEVGLVVEPKVDGTCRRSSLGVEVCTASVVIEGRACGAGAVFSARSAQASATDATDQAQALRRATSRIQVQPLVDETRARVLTALGATCSAKR